jgi:cytochrome b subunit of formate dehydrogenase
MTPQQTVTPVVSSIGSRGVDSVLKRRWTRLLVPSLSDLFFVALIVWLFVAGAHGWQSLLADGDVGWHIRTGEYILNHHNVPHHDLYSFSKPGAPWYAWEWLTDVFDALLFRSAGLKGVVLAAGVVIAWFATTLMRRVVNAGAHLFAALMVTLLSVGSASMHFLARPHVFTLLLLSISMGIIESDRRGGNPSRIWWLVPITLVWTNLHGGFLVLIAVLGLAAAGSAVEAWLARPQVTNDWLARPQGNAPDWKQALRYAKLTAACAAVSFINPYGWGLHVHVVQYLQSDWIRKVVQEFQSPSFRNENMLQFEVLLFIGLIAAGARFRRAQVTEGLWVLAFAYLALSGVRHVPVFVAVTAPLIAAEATAWWRAWADGASKKSAAGILNQMGADIVPGFQRSSVWGVIVVVVLALTGAPIAWPKDFPEEMFPIALVHAHEQEILHSRVLTTDQWADYLIYLHPEQKVFVDGRSDFYGPEIGNQFLNLMGGAPDWQQIMERYKFNLALIPADSAVAQLLRQRPDWRVVDQDKKQVLLALQGNPEFAEGTVLKN